MTSRMVPQGRRHETGLGSLQIIDLTAARDKAHRHRQALLEGRSPLAEKRALLSAEQAEHAKLITFDHCAATYIVAHRHGWKNGKHVQQWQRTLATYHSTYRLIARHRRQYGMHRQCAQPDLGRQDRDRGKVRGRIESILDWATVKQYRLGDNPARWRGHLENLLAAPGKITKVKNHPALPWRAIRTFMGELRQREGVAARAVEFAILTACRSGEVRGAQWKELDFEAKLWTVPADRMEAGKEHRVPLSTATLDCLLGWSVATVLFSLERTGARRFRT